jgi:hypothetical protein
MRLVTTANSPEMEMAWPAIPTVARRSDAIGVKRLTGMNSDAISIAAHIAMDPTALHTWRLETVDWSISVDIVFPLSRCARAPNSGCLKHAGKELEHRARITVELAS